MMRQGGARASTPIDDGNVMASINSSLPARTVDGGIVVVTSAEPVVLDDPAGPSLVARLGAEAFGTFGLVLVILGAGLYLSLSNAGTLGVVLAAGLVLAGLIAALGHISGGHFNPAVSLGAAFSGRLSIVDLLLYWLAQVFGGVLAAAILFVTIPAALPTLLGAADSKAFFALTANGWGTHSPLSALSSGQVTFDLKSALIIEVVATAVFVADHRRDVPAGHRRGRTVRGRRHPRRDAPGHRPGDRRRRQPGPLHRRRAVLRRRCARPAVALLARPAARRSDRRAVRPGLRPGC